MKGGIIIAGVCVILVSVILLTLTGGKKTEQGVVNSGSSISIPAPSNYLVDVSGVLTQETIMKLNAELKAFDNSSNTAQIGVLVVTSTQPLTIEQYSIAVAQNWKVGYKGSNNGILFTLATNDRKTRIEVGKGFEGELTDVQANDILQQYAVPFFHNQDWNAGVIATVEALINKLKK